MKLMHTNVDGDYIHYCPACEQLHQINTKRRNHNNAQWSFDGNLVAPTFSPSINILKIDGDGSQCHYFIKNGMIEYCSDSAHDLKGKTVELPDFPDYYINSEVHAKE